MSEEKYITAEQTAELIGKTLENLDIELPSDIGGGSGIQVWDGDLFDIPEPGLWFVEKPASTDNRNDTTSSLGYIQTPYTVLVGDWYSGARPMLLLANAYCPYQGPIYDPENPDGPSIISNVPMSSPGYIFKVGLHNKYEGIKWIEIIDNNSFWNTFMSYVRNPAANNGYLNASTYVPGFLPNLSGDENTYLNGLGEWAEVASGGSSQDVPIFIIKDTTRISGEWVFTLQELTNLFDESKITDGYEIIVSNLSEMGAKALSFNSDFRKLYINEKVYDATNSSMYGAIHPDVIYRYVYFQGKFYTVSAVGTSKLDASRIPFLPASIITSGTLHPKYGGTGKSDGSNLLPDLPTESPETKFLNGNREWAELVVPEPEFVTLQDINAMFVGRYTSDPDNRKHTDDAALSYFADKIRVKSEGDKVLYIHLYDNETAMHFTHTPGWEDGKNVSRTVEATREKYEGAWNVGSSNDFVDSDGILRLGGKSLKKITSDGVIRIPADNLGRWFYFDCLLDISGLSNFDMSNIKGINEFFYCSVSDDRDVTIQSFEPIEYWDFSGIDPNTYPGKLGLSAWIETYNLGSHPPFPSWSPIQ